MSAEQAKGRIVQTFRQEDLAKRWGVSPRTLEQWRWRGIGPRYLKLGGRVIYRLADIEAFEAERVHLNTNGPLAGERG